MEEIINAQRRHIEALEALEQRCFSLPWTRRQLESQLPDGGHEFLVAESGGELLGYAGMMCVLDEGYISNVAVAPEHRRRGIAAGLIEALLVKARERELSFVTLEVRESNTPAIALYKKYGFAQVGQRKNYYDLPRENAILMTKFLK